MSDDIEAITESAKAVVELAKTAGKAIDLTSDFGAYLAKILGEVPADLIGLLGGDYLGQVRTRNLDKCVRKTKKIIDDRNAETEPVSLSIAIPLLREAENESREGVQDLWARLLANAMDRERSDQVRLEFIETIKQLNPRDALFLDYLDKFPRGSPSGNTRDELMSKFGLPESAVIVSLQHLVRLELAHNLDQGGLPQKFTISFYGTELCKACQP
jgi:hypothetical protein